MCATVHVSLPASAYCMVMKAMWLVVVLGKQPSLGDGEVGVIVYGCARVRERAHGDVWLVVGCLSASAGLDECALCMCSMY